jgi:DNA-binding transcriptional regulator YdaS (Cro superfamily)
MPMSDSHPKPISLAALEEAIAIAGSQSELGRFTGKSQGHVAQWLQRGRCPAELVLTIEEKTGVSRHRLREDVFGPAPNEVAQ